MIKIYSILFFLTLSLYANHLNWLGNYDKALQHAKKEQKDLMVYLVKEDIPACQNTLKNSLMNHPYIERLKSRFVSVIVTYEGRTSYPVEMYYSQTFPTLFFVDSLHEHFLTPPLYGDMITPPAIKGFLDE
jgi:thioredoxin-related protein